MIFVSLDFALFFLITCFVYYITPVKYRWICLLLSGIFFYSFHEPADLFIPFFIVLVTWYGGILIGENGSTPKARNAYYIAILANIGLLIFFKYADLFTNGIYDLLNITRKNLFNRSEPLNNLLLINLVAPLGISYLTFQAIGYLVEIKRGNQTAEKNLGHFSAYLFFFPKLIAGPVERAHHFLPQLKRLKFFDYDKFVSGLKLLIWGLFKKVVIADRLSIYVSAVFGNVTHHSGITLIVAVILFVFQLYTDFSGYTDMALGLAKMLGFDLIQNFSRPFLAKSVTEFWRKWHISLSTWFADYFYNPIAIAKRDWGKWGVIYAFFVTFVTLGLWHGANWTFVIFGALQGFILTIEFFTRKTRKQLRKRIPAVVNNLVGIGYTFFYFAFSAIFFKAANVKDAVMITRGIFQFKPGDLYIENPSIIIFSLLGVGFLILTELKKEYFDNAFSLSNNRSWFVRNCYYCFLLVIIVAAGVFDGGEFIYFQF